MLGTAAIWWFGPMRFVIRTRTMVRETEQGDELASAHTLVFHVIRGPRYMDFENFFRSDVKTGTSNAACETCFANREEILVHKHE